MPPIWRSAVSVWNRADGTAGVPDERLAGSVDHRRQRLQALGGRHKPIGERREFTRLEAEQALADEIDPVERVPRVLAERPSR